MFATPFIDETFDIYNCRNYILSIQCALDGFSFSIYDTTVKKFIVFSEFDINTASDFELRNTLDDVIQDEPILKQSFKKVNIAYTTTKYTLVPTALFNARHNDLYLKQSVALNRDDKVFCNNLSSEVAIHFAVPELLVELFEKYFPGCSFFHNISPILNHAKNLTIHSNTVLVYQHNHTLFILVINAEKIIFHNAFYVHNTADCLYYILNTVKRFESESDPHIFLYGKIKPKSELEAGLKKFVDKVYLSQFSAGYAVSYTLYKEPENFHLVTLELAICE